jgi:hypothetical protein
VAAFPHIPLPAGVPTLLTFKVTITSVCETEIITAPTLSDMEFTIKPSAVLVIQNFTPFVDNNSEFCGTLSYTLSKIGSAY